MLKKLIKKVLKSEFNRNALILISGTVAAQLLPILISPLLTRLYTPEQLGLLSVFMSASIILGNIVGGKYELAIVLPHKDNDAVHLLAIGFILTTFWAIVIFVVAITLNHPIAQLLKAPKLANWLPLLPLGVFGVSMFNFFNLFFTRIKSYSLISVAKINRGVLTAAIQLGFAFLKSAGALIIGYLAGHLIGTLTFLYKFARLKIDKKIKKIKLLALLRKYKKFPFYNVPSVFANRLASDMGNYLISPFFGLAELGYYSMAFRVMNVPSYFIGMSMAQVYIQTAADELKRDGTVHKAFYSVLKKLLIISVPIFLLIFVTIKPFLTIFFGKAWEASGIYAMIMTPFIFIRFIVSPLSNTLQVIEKQELLFLYQILLLIFSAAGFVTGHLLGYDLKHTLIIYTVFMAIAYFIVLVIVWYQVEKLRRKKLKPKLTTIRNLE